MRSIIEATLSLTLLAFASLLDAEQPVYQPLTEEQKRQIDAALPNKPPVRPRQPRRLLVTSLCIRNGSPARGHPSIPFGNYAIEQMGRRTGAYETVISDDVDLFRPGKIKQFDAICFNNALGILFDDAELKESLLGFIAGGKGFVGFHAACVAFVQYPRYDFWPEFGQMLGGAENGGHPWGPNDVFTIRVDDPKSPINRVFKGRSFEITEEVFQFQEPNLRERLRVLLSIDPDKSIPKRRVLPIRMEDKDFPMSWIKPHGKGRVFYSALGHNAHIFWNPPLLAHFLAGIQYALGDLKADNTPSAKLKRRNKQ